MRKKIYIDLTDIAQWQGHFTGIQRLVYNIAYFYHQNKQADFFVYDEVTRKFYRSDFEEIIIRTNALSSETVGSPKSGAKDIIRAIQVRTPYILTSKVGQGTRRRIKSSAKSAYGTAAKLKHKLKRNSRASRAEEINFDHEDTVLVLGNNWDRPTYMEDLKAQKIESGTKIYQVIYDLIPAFHPHLFGPELFRIYTQYIFEVISISDELFCISKSTQKDLNKFAAKAGLQEPSSHIIRLGDSLERTSSKPISKLVGRDFVVCTGTIEVRKNHTLLYYAWKDAIARGRDMPTLVIVGKAGWHTENIRHILTHDPELNDKIFVFERASDEELRWLYENCEFSVYPSMYEGWGLPIAESLSYGKLCVASNTSSMPEIAGDLIDYFSPFDSSECMEKISYYHSNKKALETKNDKIVKSYTSTNWESTYLAIDKIISSE